MRGTSGQLKDCAPLEKEEEPVVVPYEIFQDEEKVFLALFYPKSGRLAANISITVVNGALCVHTVRAHDERETHTFVAVMG